MRVTSRGDGGAAPPLDLAGFAQEFLRRSPAYRRAYSHAMRPRIEAREDRQNRLEEMARPWGLTFSVRAGHLRVSGACSLARLRKPRSRYLGNAGAP
jgi:hypothetical protein